MRAGLERASGMVCGKEFKVGYSPERINPGDHEHTLARVIKVVSGMDAETLEIVAQVYGLVATKGVFRAASIKTAEAAKVIENTQRDLNIALMNKLAMIFHRIGLQLGRSSRRPRPSGISSPSSRGWSAGTASASPRTISRKAERLGYHPQVILAGGRINDSMGKFIAEQTIKMLVNQEISVRQARVAVLGITLKENVPDIRNSKVVDIIHELSEYGLTCLVHDPLASPEETHHEYGLRWFPNRRSAAASPSSLP